MAAKSETKPKLCPMCGGVRLVAPLKGSRDRDGEEVLAPSRPPRDAYDAISSGIRPCPACEGAGVARDDFDEQVVDLYFADPEVPAAQAYLGRTHPVGHDHRSAELRFVTPATVMTLVDLKPSSLRRLATFLERYAGRMEEF